MTRINLVPVEELYDQHLMAEYRELPMVEASLKRSLASKKGVVVEEIPEEYCLGAGHVKFFYNKGSWLEERYWLLVAELRKRGFNIEPYGRAPEPELWIDYNLWHTDWQPNEIEVAINKKRIDQRVSEKPGWYRKTEYV